MGMDMAEVKKSLQADLDTMRAQIRENGQDATKAAADFAISRLSTNKKEPVDKSDVLKVCNEWVGGH
eukprot:9361437-Karenia_brevis.AAC.1